MDPRLRAVAEAAKGFMPPEEGIALYEAGLLAGRLGPLLEIGTYCGKSAVYLGAAARDRETVLFTIDHHRGSEEMQSPWEHHDPDVVDARTGRMDSLPFFRKTMDDAGLDDVVIAIVGDSPVVARGWTTPVALVFIDGGHSEHIAMADYEAWADKLIPDGLLAIHDVFEDPSEGGQGPFHVFEVALGDGYEHVGTTGSLRTLKKRA